MGRLTQTNLPDNGQATRTFNEGSFPLSVTNTVKVTSTLNLVSPPFVDGLGRDTTTRLDSDPQGTTYTDVTYDALGRKATVSNPYRTTGDPTYGITSYQYDALGRVTLVIPPDGSHHEQCVHDLLRQLQHGHRPSLEEAQGMHRCLGAVDTGLRAGHRWEFHLRD